MEHKKKYIFNTTSFWLSIFYDLRKLLNIPESKGLLHTFKFDLEIPFPPLSYPKTLYYQLDPERHTKPKMLNIDVKNISSMFVSCDLGLSIDDLNMKPHIYNL